MATLGNTATRTRTSTVSKITTAVSDFANKVKGGFGEDSTSTLPIWVLGLMAALLLVCFIVWLKYRGTYETPNNIRDIVSSRFVSANDIVKQQGTRQGFEVYLSPCENATPGSEAAVSCTKQDFGAPVSREQGILSNFYFSTVNVTGLFFPESQMSDSPSKMEYVFSPEAIKFACRGGARSFVLDIWPSMEPLGGFRPILQVVEEGSNWRRISINSMEFSTAIQTIVSEIYTEGIQGTNKTINDVCVLYLRFRGVPRKETYQSVATTLAQYTLPYLLDPTMAYARGMKGDRLMNTNMQDLKGKIVIVTNKMASELETSAPALFPYVNICPSDSIKVEYTLADLENDVNPQTTKRNIQSSLTFLALPTNDAIAHTNDWNWKKAYDMGIHCIAMNFFNRETERSVSYFNTVFPTYSYRMKAPVLYKTIAIVPESSVSRNPGIDNGVLTNTAGIDPLAGLDVCINPFTELKRLYAEALNIDNLGAYPAGRVSNTQRPEVLKIQKLYESRIIPEKRRFASNNCQQNVERARELRSQELQYNNRITELIG